MTETLLNGKVTLHCGDCLEVLATMEENSIDAVVTDPPYHLTAGKKGGTGEASLNLNSPAGRARISTGFMGKQWDGGDIAFRPETWAAVYRVLKPGAHLLAFSGTRTYHRMACAIEDAGFEVRDQVGWMYGSGFPKSHDVAKAIDKDAGHWRGRAGDIVITEQCAKGTEYERTDKGEPITAAAAAWSGFGTALKPAWEPVVLARKPLSEKTVAANVLRWGTGAINVDGCRVGTDGGTKGTNYAKTGLFGIGGKADIEQIDAGRWPANVIHDGSEEVVAMFPETASAGQYRDPDGKTANVESIFGNTAGRRCNDYAGDSGSAARFFYSAKADADDRIGSNHPTVKPVDVMQYLCRLVTPPGGTVLDPFSGTGTTGEAAFREGFRAVLIEREAEYQEDIRRRMKLAMAGPDEKRRESIKAKTKDKPVDLGPLFGGNDTPQGGAGRFTGTSPIRTDDRTNRTEGMKE